MAHTNVKFNLMVKQDNTWYAPRTETKGIESLKSQKSRVMDSEALFLNN